MSTSKGRGAMAGLPPAPSTGVIDTLRCNALFLREPDTALERLHDSLGPVARVRLGPLSIVLLVGADANRFIMTAGPDEIRAGPIWDRVLPFYRGALLSTDGAEHLAQRRLLQAAFRRAGASERVDEMLDVVRARMTRWHGRIDAYCEMRRMTLDVTARVLLGIDLDERTASRYLEWQRALSAMILSPPGPGFPLGRRRQGMRAQQQVWAFLRDVIAQRRRDPGEDVLSMLIADHEHDDERLLVHAFTLLSAGHETTASYLTFALAMLAVRPDVLERIESEQRERLGAGPPTAEALRDLPATSSFLLEVERLFPPTPYVARTAMADLEFAGCRIPRGSTLMGSIRLTHLLGELFAQPREFRPDRFASPRRPGPFELVGFGGGPHVCLGKGLALIESTLVLHAIVNRFRILPASSREPPIARFRPFAQPAAPITIELARRDEPAW